MITQETARSSRFDPLLAIAAGIGTGFLIHKSFDTLGWQGNFWGDVGNIGLSSWLGLATVIGSYGLLTPSPKLAKSEMSQSQRADLLRITTFGLLYASGVGVLSYIGMSAIHATPDALNVVAAGSLSVVNAYGFRKAGRNYARLVK